MKKKEKIPTVVQYKKFKEVLGELQIMISDSERRLQASLEDLSLFLDTNNSLGDSEHWVQAREPLQNSSEDRKCVETHVEDDSDTF